MPQTERERELSQLARVDQSLNVVLEQLNLGAPNKLIQKDLKRISKNSGYPLERIQTRFDDIRREAALEANPLLETRQIRAEGGEIIKDYKKQLKKYKDIWSDESGKYTKKEQAKAADEHNIIAQTMNQYVEDPIEILVGPFKKTKVGKPGYNRKTKRTLYETGGDVDNQMSMLMESEETHTMPDGTVMPGATHGEYEEQMEGLMDKETPMLPDEEMEEDYVDHVVSSTLEEEDQNYLESALAEDAKLSEIFDQVVESASEFSGSGPIEGPGTEVSDSIPARLSDGEFVFTAKATDEIGEDNLMSMMKDAEAAADERQGVATGGVIEEDEQQQALAISTEGTAESKGNIPSVLPLRATEEELYKSMLQASPRQYYRPTSG